MVLVPSLIGDSPQQPGVQAEAYIPDQLIAGNLKLVTTPGTLGAGTLPRGTVCGQQTQGTVAAGAGVAASGTATFSALPAAGDTLSFAGTTVTFVANTVLGTANNFPLGNPQAAYPNVQEFLDAFIPWLNASIDTNLVKGVYSGTGSVLTITAATSGTAGNSLALSKVSTAIVVSAANLSGGAANTGNGTFGTITRGASFRTNGPYVLTMLTATTFSLVDPNGVSLPNGATGVAYTDAQLNFTLTAGGTAFVANDSFHITQAAGSGNWVLSVATATDGSQVPGGILVDFADASGGAVTTGFYVMGEFNPNAMSWDDSWSLPALRAAFSPRPIYLKSFVSATDPY